MIEMIVGAASAAVGAIVSAIGAAVAQGDYDKARELRQQAMSEYGDIILPKLDKALAEEIGPSQFAAIQEDPGVRNTQTDAMRRLSQIYESGGMTQGDEAALALANRGAQSQAASDYQSMQQSLAARGQSGNPALAAALAAKTGGDVVNATAMNRYQAQADARNRAMQALSMSGQLAGQIRGQDWEVASGRASAMDRVNQFNAGQRTNANNENAARAQQQFGNQMSLANSKNNARENMAADYTGAGNLTANQYAAVGNAISTAGGAAAGRLADREQADANNRAKYGRTGR